jgi:hypothetical protein
MAGRAWWRCRPAPPPAQGMQHVQPVLRTRSVALALPTPLLTEFDDLPGADDRSVKEEAAPYRSLDALQKDR